MRTLILLLSLLGLAQPAVAADINGQLKRADLENLSADPSLKATGRVYFNTSSAKAKYWSGSAWLTVVDTTNTLLNGAVQNPMASLGDLIYGASAGTPTALSGNTTSTKKFLTQTGTGTISAVPAWGTVVDADLPTTLSGHTLATPTLSSYADVTEVSAPASPAASTLRVYAKSDDKLYTLNPSGVETQVGSGSGEKNYISKGTSTAAGWAASGAGVTCTTVTSGLPDATVGTALAVTGVSGSTAYCFSNFDLDIADYNKKMKLAFDQAPVSGYAASDQRVDVYSCTVAWSGSPATTCSGTSTRLPLSTDSSSVSALPNLTGTYRTTWDSPGSAAAHIQVRVGLNGTNTHQNNLAQIVAGPGVVTQGAAVTGWQSCTATVSWSGTGMTTTCQYRRIGDSIQERVAIVPGSGALSGGALTVSIPSGLTINTGALAGGSGTPVGGWLGYHNSTLATYLGNVNVNTTINVTLSYNASGGSGSYLVSTTNPTTWATTSDEVAVDFTVPINEWTGSGTVNIGSGNDPEYQSNSSTSSSNDTTSFSPGPAGQLIPTITASAVATSVAKRVRFSTPIQSTDTLVLEVQDGGTGNWTPIGAEGSYAPFSIQGTVRYGLAIGNVNATDVDVFFYQGGRVASGASFGAAGASYPGTAGDRWRLKKFSGGQAVGFGTVVPGVSSGLVSASGLPASSGQSVGAGYAGYISTVTGSMSGLTSTLTQLATISSTVLQPGNWLLSGMIYVSGGAGNYMHLTIGPTSASDTGSTSGYGFGIFAYNSSTGNGTAVIPAYVVTLTTPTAYYLNAGTDAASNTVHYSLQAQRLP